MSINQGYNITRQVQEIIHKETGTYVRRLLSAIAESGLDARAMPTVFLGGGTALLKHHVSATDGRTA